MSLAVAAAALDKALKGTNPSQFPPELPAPYCRPPPNTLSCNGRGSSKVFTNSRSFKSSPGENGVPFFNDRPKVGYHEDANVQFSVAEGNSPRIRRNSFHSNHSIQYSSSCPGKGFPSRVKQQFYKGEIPPHFKNSTPFRKPNSYGGDAVNQEDNAIPEVFHSIPRFPFRNMTNSTSSYHGYNRKTYFGTYSKYPPVENWTNRNFDAKKCPPARIKVNPFLNKGLQQRNLHDPSLKYSHLQNQGFSRTVKEIQSKVKDRMSNSNSSDEKYASAMGEIFSRYTKPEEMKGTDEMRSAKTDVIRYTERTSPIQYTSEPLDCQIQSSRILNRNSSRSETEFCNRKPRSERESITAFENSNQIPRSSSTSIAVKDFKSEIPNQPTSLKKINESRNVNLDNGITTAVKNCTDCKLNSKDQGDSIENSRCNDYATTESYSNLKHNSDVAVGNDIASHPKTLENASFDNPISTTACRIEDVNLMFDFIYHSESADVVSSSPKKLNSSSVKDNFVKHETLKTRSANKPSVVSCIMSSRKKLFGDPCSPNKSQTELKDSRVAEKELPSIHKATTITAAQSDLKETIPELQVCDQKLEENIDIINQSREEVSAEHSPGILCTTLAKVQQPLDHAPEIQFDQFQMRTIAARPRRSSESALESRLWEKSTRFFNLDQYNKVYEVDTNKYKTELCRAYQSKGSCRYGSRCNYAHGLDQLKVSFHHGKYKTRNCQAYHESGYCRYGARCSFIHDLEEGILKCSIANKEILEALHHWPEEQSDTSATVTWRVFNSGYGSSQDETLLEFTAIPSLKQADMDSCSHNSSTEHLPQIYSLDANGFSLKTAVHVIEPRPFGNARDGSNRNKVEMVNQSYGTNSPNRQSSPDSFPSNLATVNKSSMIRNSVNDLMTLLRSVETNSISIRRVSGSNGSRKYPISNCDRGWLQKSVEGPNSVREATNTTLQHRDSSLDQHDRRVMNESRLESKQDEILPVDETIVGGKCHSFHMKGYCLHGPECKFVHD